MDNGRPILKRSNVKLLRVPGTQAGRIKDLIHTPVLTQK